MVEPPFSETEIRRYWESRLPGLTQQRTNEKGEWRLPCPLHGGERKSFSINPRTGRYFCHSKCAAGGDILAYEQKKYGGDFPAVKARAFEIIGRSDEPPAISEPKATAKGNGDRPDERYEYTDESGRVLYYVVRYYVSGDPEKRFYQCRPDGRGGEIKGLGGVEPVPYRLPQLLAAGEVYDVEGEKDTHTLLAWNLTATTCSGGASNSDVYAKWAEKYYKGKRVKVLYDNDERGRKHALARAAALLPFAASVHVIELPGLPEKGDVTDWKERGGTREEFLKLAAAALPLDEAKLEALRSRWGLIKVEEAHQAATAEARGCPEVGGVNWPDKLRDEAFHGPAGEVVRAIEPHSEADPAAILIQFLVLFGNLIGRTAHFRTEADSHYMNLYAVMVGQTAKGRKGTSFGHVRSLVGGLDPEWVRERHLNGLSSGEGLIWAVRDEKRENAPIKDRGRISGYEEVITDHGEKDKRALVIEPEFARVLQATEREANTLSAIIRQAWDSGDLRILTKKESARATGAHISIIGHITTPELTRTLTDTAMGNGFANRFLWCCTRRSKLLPEGGALHTVDLSKTVEKLRRAAEFARGVGEIRRDEQARVMWCGVYPVLSEGKPGLLGAVTSRAEAQTMRLACIYALLDGSALVNAEHLSAALEVWRYCEDSARFIFGDAMGDAVADEIHRELRRRPHGMTRSDIRDHFGRNKSSAEIVRALESLRMNGLARGGKEKEEDQQRKPTERWFSIR